MIRETVTMASTDVLVVGAGAGGLAVAAEMRQISARASVTVATESTDQLYRPWLIYAPAGRLQSKLAPKIPYPAGVRPAGASGHASSAATQICVSAMRRRS